MSAKTKTGFETLWTKATKKAREAWIEAQPAPILIYTPKGLFDDTPNIEEPMYVHSEGVCGFGWIIVKDGRTAFARWLAKHDIGTTSAYYGGRMVSSYDLVPEDRKSQSYDRKCAAVYAAVRVLNEAGIQAEAVTRMD